MKVWSARGSLLVLGLGLFAACGSAEREDRGNGSDDGGEGGSAEAGSAGSVAARGGSAGSDSSAGTSGSAGDGSGTAGNAGSATGGTGSGGSAGTAGTSDAGGEPGGGGSPEAGGNTSSGGGSSGAGATSGAGGGPNTCSGAPVSVLFLIDSSRSNDDPMLGGGEPKWPIVRDVLMSAFEQLPETLNAGLLFFPQVSSAMMPPCFEVDNEIPIAPFDASQRQAFSSALQAVVPDGGTPTYDAYDYVTLELDALDTSGPRVIVLVTDGVPNYLPECNGNAVENVEWEPLVDMVLAANETGIHTLAVASPFSSEIYPMVSAIATAGGSLGVCNGTAADGCFFDMDVSFDLGPWLVESLGALDCDP